MLQQRPATPPASSAAVALRQPRTISSETPHLDGWYSGPFGAFASAYSCNTQAEAVSDFTALSDRFIINPTDPTGHNSISPSFAMFGDFAISTNYNKYPMQHVIGVCDFSPMVNEDVGLRRLGSSEGQELQGVDLADEPTRWPSIPIKQHHRSTDQPRLPAETFLPPTFAQSSQPKQVLSLAATSKTEHLQEQHTRSLVENCSDMAYVLSRKGTFLYASAAAERMLEYKPRELIGKPLASLLHPCDSVTVLRELKQSDAQDHSLVTLLYRIRRKQSGYCWLASEGKLHSDARKDREFIILTGRIIRPYTMSRRDLAAASKLGHSDWWGKVTFDGRLLYSTTSVRSMIGYTKEEVVGMRFDQFCSNEDVLAIKQALTRASSGETVSLQYGMKHKTTQAAVQVTTDFFSPRSLRDGPPCGEDHTSRTVATIICRTSLVQANARSLCTTPPSTPSSLSTSQTTLLSWLWDEAGSPSSWAASTSKPSSPVSFDTCRPPGPLSTRTVPASAEATAFRTYDHVARSDNVFDELGSFRNTSWQFELRQLELTNRKLCQQMTTLVAFQRRKRSQRTGQRMCANCGRITSAEWRTGPTGPKSLCNRCGLRWSKAKKNVAAQQAR